jgi:hypothetical protein
MYAYFYFVGDVYSMKTEGASFHASLPPSFHLFKSKLDHMLGTDTSYGAVDNPGIRCASGFDILAFFWSSDVSSLSSSPVMQELHLPFSVSAVLAQTRSCFHFAIGKHTTLGRSFQKIPTSGP